MLLVCVAVADPGVQVKIFEPVAIVVVATCGDVEVEFPDPPYSKKSVPLLETSNNTFSVEVARFPFAAMFSRNESIPVVEMVEEADPAPVNPLVSAVSETEEPIKSFSGIELDRLPTVGSTIGTFMFIFPDL